MAGNKNSGRKTKEQEFTAAKEKIKSEALIELANSSDFILDFHEGWGWHNKTSDSMGSSITASTTDKSKELAEILFAPEISPLTPLVTIPLAVMVTIVFPATLAIILLLALAKYTLLVPLLIYEPEPPPLADMVTLLTDVIRPLAATVMTGTIVELP